LYQIQEFAFSLLFTNLVFYRIIRKEKLWWSLTSFI